MKNFRNIFSCFFGFVMIIAGFILVIYFFVKEEPEIQSKQIEAFEIKSLIPSTITLFENQISLSPDSKYYTFLTADGLSLKNSKIWLINSTGKELQPIAFGEEYKNLTSPSWDPTSTKIAFLKVFPFELYIHDIKSKQTKLIYDENDHKEDNVLNPSLGYGNKAYLLWLNNNEIEFENNKPIETEYYSINIETKEIKKTSRKKDVKVETKRTDINKFFFSQRDIAWREAQLGGCENETFESAGCTVSAASMLLAYYNYDTNPVDLNSFLTKNEEQGYFEGCLVRWNILPNYSEGLTLKGVYFNEFNIERLDYEISKGNPVLIGYNYVSFTGIPHWIMIVSKQNGQYMALDPWDTYPRLVAYTKYGDKFDHMIVYEME